MPFLEFAMAKYTLYVYKKGPLKGIKEPGIYEDTEGRKYIRPKQANGQRPYLSLGTASLETAIKMRDTRKMAKLAAKRGIALAPEEAAKKAAVTVPVVIRAYDEAGCPNRKGVARRLGKHLDAEKVRGKTLLQYFNTDKPAEDLGQNQLDGYKDWRVALVQEREKAAAKRKGYEDYEPEADSGLRTVDLDLNCLSNAMRWDGAKGVAHGQPNGYPGPLLYSFGGRSLPGIRAVRCRRITWCCRNPHVLAKKRDVRLATPIRGHDRTADRGDCCAQNGRPRG
jgi:hypothetical protein